jgi:uncharacterized membrane protein
MTTTDVASTRASSALASTAASRFASRFASIDLLRGIVMVLMALDHVRFFFTNLSFPPENLHFTWMSLFLTRWVTHFCAPAFFLLAGTGAAIAGARSRSRSQVARFLWTRGLWLIALELTFIGFSWQFIPGYSFAGVIWCLGCSMLILSVLVRGPVGLTGAFGAALILLHNLTDHVRPEAFGALAPAWRILHITGPVQMNAQIGAVQWFVLFPIVPWVGVMAVGYWMGELYRQNAERRQRFLIMAGWLMTAAFLLLRLTNSYGNPTVPGSSGASALFHWQPTISLTVINLLNVQKYPPSLQFLLMTLGPCLLALVCLERMRAGSILSRAIQPIEVFGRVPMFYYVIHLYLIHLAALVVAVLWGQPSAWLKFGGLPLEDRTGYGHGLPFVWALWIAVVVLLYFPCRWFMAYKRTHAAWWLRYL